MGDQSPRKIAAAGWKLSQAQHGVVTRAQLLELGLSAKAIKHRVHRGRLHPVRTGVYAVGHPRLSCSGFWMAAVLSCGPEARLSHLTAAAVWGIHELPGDCRRLVDVTVPARVDRRRPGIRVHRRDLSAEDLTRRHGIPITSPARTLLDLATLLPPPQVEAAVNRADKLDLIDPERLREVLARRGGARGAPALRKLLDRRTFRLTDSELERRFLRLVREAGLPAPETGRVLNGYRVDFFWPELGLVGRDRWAPLPPHGGPAGEGSRARPGTREGRLTPLRFTHAQVAHDSRTVIATLIAVARRLGGQ